MFYVCTIWRLPRGCEAVRPPLHDYSSHQSWRHKARQFWRLPCEHKRMNKQDLEGKQAALFFSKNYSLSVPEWFWLRHSFLSCHYDVFSSSMRDLSVRWGWNIAILGIKMEATRVVGVHFECISAKEETRHPWGIYLLICVGVPPFIKYSSMKAFLCSPVRIVCSYWDCKNTISNRW